MQNKFGLQTSEYSLFFDRLAKLYAGMDSEYKKAADYYSFHCTGCKDNCCLTRFYHHTFLEYFYILKGCESLDPETKTDVVEKASELCRKSDDADEKGMKMRIMCPLNFSGMCVLYDYRPMICRLHGIPHELHMPGRDVFYGSGCEFFTDQSEGKNYFKFDRTPFYFEMSRLETELKRSAGIIRKMKMTVAQMLLPD